MSDHLPRLRTEPIGEAIIRCEEGEGTKRYFVEYEITRDAFEALRDEVES